MRIMTYDPRKDKEVIAGIYDTDAKIFTKTVTKRNLMRKEGGYGIQAEVMEDLYNRHCSIIKIKIGKKIYTLLFITWYLEGKFKNYGHGDQYFYPIKFMTKEK